MSSPDQALLTRKIESTPAEFAAYLRDMGRLFWWERGKFWVITDYELAESGLKSADLSADRSSFFISRMPNLDLRLIADFFGVIKKMMVMSDAPEHTARRKLAALGIADKVIDGFRPNVERAVDELLERASGKPRIEFVSEIAEALPSTLLADLFCIPRAERASFYAWSNDMTQFFGGASQYRNEDGIAVNRSASRIRDYFLTLVRERRASPQDDFLSILLRHQASFGLDDSEVVSQAIMMLVAGQITTTDQLCNNLYSLLTVDGALATLRARPEMLDAALEEFNRLDPAVTFLFRVAARDTMIADTRIPSGGVVFISTHAVNRDPRVFEMPESCRFDRPRNPHFAYGHGSHFCLGAKLARIQMSRLFGEMLRRFPALRLDDTQTAVRKHHSLAFSGFEKLPLRVDG